jgi:uncharacterized protein
MKRSLACLAAVVVMVVPSCPFAAEPAPADTATLERKQVLVRRYFSAIDYEKQVDGMMALMLPMVADQAARGSPNMSQKDRAALTEATREVMREVVTPKLLEGSIPIYAEAFTEQELIGLVEFYESPTGRAITEGLPAIAPKVADLTRGILPEAMREVITRLCAKIGCTVPPTGKPRPS